MQNTRSKLRYLINRFIRSFDNELIKVISILIIMWLIGAIGILTCYCQSVR